MLLLLGATALLAGLVSRLRGTRAGFAAAAAFAGSGAVPFLAGWASGCQDLFALVFLFAAAHFELSRRRAPALLCAALALLSKETAAAAFPALMLVPRLLRGERGRFRAAGLQYGAILAAWLAVHPGLHVLLGRGFRAGATGYVGWSDPGLWLPRLGRYVCVALNWPVTGLATPWPGWLTVALAVAVALLLGGVAALAPSGGGGRAPRGGVLLFAACLSLPPLFPTVTLLDTWAPYYVVPVIAGAAVAVGVLLERAPRALLLILFTGYLALGVLCRGADLEAVSERGWLRQTDADLKRVRAGLDRLLPQLPRGSRLLATVYVPTNRRVWMHFYFYQAPSVWRMDPTLLTLRPDWRLPGHAPEFLFGVGPDLSTFTVDPGTKSVLWEGHPPDSTDVRLTLRYYACGLALTGGTDQALRLLRSMPGGSRVDRSVDARVAAMLLAAAGREAEAAEAIRSAGPVPRERAVTEITQLLMDAPPGSRWDEPALRAFGFDPGDTNVLRVLIQNFVWGKKPGPARRFADRLLEIRPSDPDALSALRYIARMKPPDAFAYPAPPEVVRRAMRRASSQPTP